MGQCRDLGEESHCLLFFFLFFSLFFCQKGNPKMHLTAITLFILSQVLDRSSSAYLSAPSVRRQRQAADDGGCVDKTGYNCKLLIEGLILAEQECNEDIKSSCCARCRDHGYKAGDCVDRAKDCDKKRDKLGDSLWKKLCD